MMMMFARYGTATELNTTGMYLMLETAWSGQGDYHWVDLVNATLEETSPLTWKPL